MQDVRVRLGPFSYEVDLLPTGRSHPAKLQLLSIGSHNVIPVQYIEILRAVKMKKIVIYFLFSGQNRDCGNSFRMASMRWSLQDPTICFLFCLG